RVRERAVGRTEIDQMLTKCFKLTEREVQLGIFIGDTAKILRRSLEFLHSGSSFGGHRLDYFEHLGRSFTKIWDSFAREHFTIFRAAGALGPLCHVDRHVTEQS